MTRKLRVSTRSRREAGGSGCFGMAPAATRFCQCGRVSTSQARDPGQGAGRVLALHERQLDPRGAPQGLAREVPHEVVAVPAADDEVLAPRPLVLLAPRPHFEEVAEQA